MATAPAASHRTVDAVRGFNRFYTRQIGLLGEHVFESPFSLSETRVLYELAHRDRPTASELGKDLGLDAGYLSRMLRRFEAKRLIVRTSSPTDGRQTHLRLTARGRSVFAPLESRARSEVGSMLGKLSALERRQVVDAMAAIERALTDPVPRLRAGQAPRLRAGQAPRLRAGQAPRLRAGQAAERTPYVLRAHKPGDMGWVVHRHGALYAEEWGYNEAFEALVARIAADFLDHFDPARERCWIAEKDGAIVGSVFVVAKSKTVAKLRMLLVEPSARGLGLGRRLVDECVRFARGAGYRTLTLWTHSQLTAARRLYQEAGFTLTHDEAVHSFGKDLVDEVWELALMKV